MGLNAEQIWHDVAEPRLVYPAGHMMQLKGGPPARYVPDGQHDRHSYSDISSNWRTCTVSFDVDVILGPHVDADSLNTDNVETFGDVVTASELVDISSVLWLLLDAGVVVTFMVSLAVQVEFSSHDSCHVK